jgi:hypothetical protein
LFSARAREETAKDEYLLRQKTARTTYESVKDPTITFDVPTGRGEHNKNLARVDTQVTLTVEMDVGSQRKVFTHSTYWI